MTVMAVLFFGAALLFSPKKGFLINSYRKLKKQFIIDHQDILKTIYYKSAESSARDSAGTDKGSVNRIAIVDYLNISLSKIKIHLLYLRRLRLISTTKDKIVLTEKGNHQAIKLVRAHRLWETYLATKMGLPAEELHEPAEKIEHLLPEEILEKVDQVLGHPQKDPHGQPIPKGDEGKEKEK